MCGCSLWQIDYTMVKARMSSTGQRKLVVLVVGEPCRSPDEGVAEPITEALVGSPQARPEDRP